VTTPHKKEKYNKIDGHMSSTVQNTIMTTPSDNNYFKILDGNKDFINTTNPTRKRQRTLSDHGFSATKPQKTPPINILGKSIGDVTTLMQKTCKHELKMTREGIRVFLSSKQDFDLTISELKKNKINYYTHQLREDQLTKFVIYGLPKVSTDDIKKGLTTAGCAPVSAKEMKIKQPRGEHHAVYLAYFKKSEKIKLQWLIENVKAICNIRVKWAHYKNESKGPTQCRNCLRFGHGSENCFIQPRCVRCAEQHKSAECPHLKDEAGKKKDRIDDSLLKCALCGGNHSASSKDCAARPQPRRQFPTRKQHQQNANHHTRPVPRYDEWNFPELPNTQPSTSTANPTQWRKADSTSQDNSELYSHGELIKIFFEMTSKLAGAKTRPQQIQIIMDIAIKYCVSNV
jgi:hypothetical protein